VNGDASEIYAHLNPISGPIDKKAREQIQVLMREPLQAPEFCIPWNPIPEEFNSDGGVSVFHLDEDYGEDRKSGEYLTIGFASYVGPFDGTGKGGAWRIDFTGCMGYRRRVTGYQGSIPLARPHEGFPALWEIAWSHYLIESGVWGGSGLYHEQSWGTVHHYVIVSAFHDVYEVLARGWRTTQLAAEWEKTNYAPMPKWPPKEE
jgi:hypothetical protein